MATRPAILLKRSLMPIVENSLYRIIDANFNRAKEGLRVCEDICRFELNHKALTAKIKKLRHQLTDHVLDFSLKRLVGARGIEEDVGKSSIPSELNRKSLEDIFYANAQRVKESIRVLEECVKLLNKDSTREFKRLRYQMYALEKKVAQKF